MYMSDEARHFTTELAVIGSGLAGFAASIFALKRNIKTAQIGNTGAIAYTTGYLDLLGGSDPDLSKAIEDPWLGIKQLRATQPNHPLCRVPKNDIQTAFEQFTSFLGECGIAYSPPSEKNGTVLTPAGTLKPTFCVPATMQVGVSALSQNKKCLIIDFKGLKGFSGRQVVANMKDKWPELSTRRLTFPDMATGEIYPEVMARSLEVAKTREKLAKILVEAAGDVKVIGLPAVLGMHAPDKVREDMELLTGLHIFEIPTMPPSVPGIRLREMFEQLFPQKGLTLIPQQKVDRLEFKGDDAELSLSDSFGPITIRAKSVILATGRFLSGGLEASFDGVTEPLLDLPVTQPDSRQSWYREKYTDSRGHEINRAGIEIDSSFRPLDRHHRPYRENLFAAGVILAHQDWIRGRCGAGVALATAYKAVEEVEKFLR